VRSGAVGTADLRMTDRTRFYRSRGHGQQLLVVRNSAFNSLSLLNVAIEMPTK
jgi:hypothetical protein